MNACRTKTRDLLRIHRAGEQICKTLIKTQAAYLYLPVCGDRWMEEGEDGEKEGVAHLSSQQSVCICSIFCPLRLRLIHQTIRIILNNVSRFVYSGQTRLMKDWPPTFPGKKLKAMKSRSIGYRSLFLQSGPKQTLTMHCICH